MSVPSDLRRFFEENLRPALAYSGGTDSTYLLYAARECGADVRAYLVQSQFQTESEIDDAIDTAEALGVEPLLRLCDVLVSPIAENPPDRCYHCKVRVFEASRDSADTDGRTLIIDGTNASDDPAERPGMRALEELGIVSPLRLCGLTKTDIRRLSKEAGLPTWDRPSNSCLATRIPAGTAITQDLLFRTDCSEKNLRELGLREFRVKTSEDGARLETVPSERAFVETHKAEIERILLKYYPNVTYGERKPGL